MTRRERLERKMERRLEWADGRRDKANALHQHNESLPYIHDIAFNTQPGHIPERARVIARTERAFEHSSMAEHHESKAAGLANQLDRAIFSDDTNPVEALELRIAENEAKRDQMKQVNALYRKKDAAGLAALGLDIERLTAKLAEAGSYWGSAPHLPYELTNLGARIRDDKKRLDQIKRDQELKQLATESVNGVTVQPRPEGYCLITFAEKPHREILTALKLAGFWWAKGSWAGKRENIPACVAELLPADNHAPIASESVEPELAHPHDICAIARSVEEMHSMVDKHWPDDIDYSRVEGAAK